MRCGHLHQIPFLGPVPCSAGHRAAPLASIHGMPEHPYSHDNQNCLWILPSIFLLWGGEVKMPPLRTSGLKMSRSKTREQPNHFKELGFYSPGKSGPLKWQKQWSDFIQQMSPGHLLHARYSIRCWGYNSEQDKWGLYPLKIYILSVRT